jgi:hypothetical protein
MEETGVLESLALLSLVVSDFEPCLLLLRRLILGLSASKRLGFGGAALLLSFVRHYIVDGHSLQSSASDVSTNQKFLPIRNLDAKPSKTARSITAAIKRHSPSGPLEELRVTSSTA